MKLLQWVLLPLFCLNFVFFAFTLSGSSQPQKVSFSKPRKLAILGDELSLGRGSMAPLDSRVTSLLSSIGKDISPEHESYVSSFLGAFLPFPQESYGLPTHIWPATSSFSESLAWVLQHFTLALSRLSFDFPRLSWGYYMAQSLGVKADSLIMAALPGEGVGSLKEQYRAVEASDSAFVDTYFILLSGADLCASSPAFLMSRERFSRTFLGFIDYVIENQRKEKRGQVQLVFLNYLGVTAFRSNADMMKKKVFLKGAEAPFTCQDILESRESFQASNIEEADSSLELFSLGKIFPEDPKISCPTVFDRGRFAEAELSFSSNFDPEQREREILLSKENQLSRLAGTVRSYRKEMQKAIEERQEEALAAGVSLFFVKEVESVMFDSSDLSDNCVDLAPSGQKKIWEKVSSFLKTKGA